MILTQVEAGHELKYTHCCHRIFSNQKDDSEQNFIFYKNITTVRTNHLANCKLYFTTHLKSTLILQ